jgi:hypothetical protein
MVKNINYLLVCTIVFGLAFISGCKQKINVPPIFEGLPDTIKICKNGYRTFNLGSIVKDLDDDDSTIVWSISSGPLLTIIRFPDSVNLKPLPNQIGNDWVNFTVTDPMGASASKTCQVYIIEPTCSLTINNIQIRHNESSAVYIPDSIIEYENKSRLVWTVSTDTTYLKSNTLPHRIRFYAKSTIIFTAVYFDIYDPDNHVYFSRSVPVEIY